MASTAAAGKPAVRQQTRHDGQRERDVGKEFDGDAPARNVPRVVQTEAVEQCEIGEHRFHAAPGRGECRGGRHHPFVHRGEELQRFERQQREQHDQMQRVDAPEAQAQEHLHLPRRLQPVAVAVRDDEAAEDEEEIQHQVAVTYQRAVEYRSA